MAGYSICIIGVSGNQGTLLAKKLGVQGKNQLLLIDEQTDKTAGLIKEILCMNPEAMVEQLSCMKDASWEADIIALDIPEEQLHVLAEKIREVVNNKTIIRLARLSIGDTEKGEQAFNDHETENNWKIFFPHAKIVKVFIGSLATYLESSNKDALKTVTELLTEAGLNPYPELKTAETINDINFYSKQLN